MRKIERRRLKITNYDWKKITCTKILIVLNVVMFLIVESTGLSTDPKHMLDWGAAYVPYIQEGQIYRLVTCMFLHFGMEHLTNNMLLLYIIGEPLERTIGKIRYLIIFLIGGLGGNILSYIEQSKDITPAVSAGASGAIFALMGAMLYVIVLHRGKIENLTFRQIAIMIIFSMYFGFTNEGVDNYAHFGGFVSGVILAIICCSWNLKSEEKL